MQYWNQYELYIISVTFETELFPKLLTNNKINLKIISNFTLSFLVKVLVSSEDMQKAKNHKSKL